MIVLDRTGSMSGSKLDSAKQGILAFMKTMDPTIDNVGLAVLPPAPTTLGGCAPTPAATPTTRRAPPTCWCP